MRGTFALFTFFMQDGAELEESSEYRSVDSGCAIGALCGNSGHYGAPEPEKKAQSAAGDMTRLIESFIAAAIVIVPLFYFVFGMLGRAEAVAAALILSAALAMVSYWLRRMRSVVADSVVFRDIVGWRAAPAYVQIPMSIVIAAGGLYVNGGALRSWMWIALLLGASALANPLHVVLASPLSGSRLVIAAIPWLGATLACAVALFGGNAFPVRRALLAYAVSLVLTEIIFRDCYRALAVRRDG